MDSDCLKVAMDRVLTKKGPTEIFSGGVTPTLPNARP